MKCSSYQSPRADKHPYFAFHGPWLWTTTSGTADHVDKYRGFYSLHVSNVSNLSLKKSGMGDPPASTQR